MRPLPTGYRSPELAEALDVIGIELKRSANSDGACRVWGDAWPCAPACPAAFPLGGGPAS